MAREELSRPIDRTGRQLATNGRSLKMDKKPHARHAIWASLLVAALLGCQSAQLDPLRHPGMNLLSDATALANARDHGQMLREELGALTRRIREDLQTAPAPSPTSMEQIRQSRSKYLALREVLFNLAFSHAAAIVERLNGQDHDPLLLRTAISVGAGDELVNNFLVAAALLSLAPSLIETWDQPDRPDESFTATWEQSLKGYRRSTYHDLFLAATERLDAHRGLLESSWKDGNMVLRMLYPVGIEPGLNQLRKTLALLQTGIAEEYFSADEREIQQLVSDSKQIRAFWEKSAPFLREAVERDQGLVRGHVRMQVFDAEKAYLALRSSLYSLAFKHLHKLTRPDIPYPLELRRRGLGISLLAAITLYENTKVLQDHIVNIPGMRSLLNEGDADRGIPKNFWDNIHREFVRIKYRDLLQEGLTEWDKLEGAGQAGRAQEEPFLLYVHDELAVNPMAAEIRKDNFVRQIARVFSYHVSQIHDVMAGGLTELEFQGSKGFGNLMGAVSLRRGKLYDNRHWTEFVQARLQAGDILLERTPFRLTSTLIPGHFGHAALYVGNEKDLVALALDNEPQVRRHWNEISRGKTIAEALRNGTQLNTVEHFLDVDDLAILRRKPGAFPPNEIREAISLAFSHLGKRYDFRFDTNTWDSIICSELVFHSYIHIPWTFGHGLALGSLTPDDIAVFAGSDDERPFALVTFIQDGVVIHDLTTNQRNEEPYIRMLGSHYRDGVRRRPAISRSGPSFSLLPMAQAVSALQTVNQEERREIPIPQVSRVLKASHHRSMTMGPIR